MVVGNYIDCCNGNSVTVIGRYTQKHLNGILHLSYTYSSILCIHIATAYQS